MFYKDCNDLLIEWCASGSHAWGSAVRTPSRPQLGVFEACLGMVCQGYLLPKKSPQPIEWPNVNLPPIRSVSAIFDNSVWVLICRRFEAWWICRPVQNTKYDLSYLFVIFGALVCDSYCRCFFCTPQHALHHFLAIHVERAMPTFMLFQARVGSLGDRKIWVTWKGAKVLTRVQQVTWERAWTPVSRPGSFFHK